MVTKFGSQNLIVFVQLALFPTFYMVIPKNVKQSLAPLQNLDLLYQLLYYIC